ncbi:FadR/GntR family transcriptional regulator [soil metagenome]
MSGDKRIERFSLIDTLVDNIEEGIVTGEYATDSRLPGEETLATTYAVSRPVVREALARLRERGYLETTNGRGTYVRRPSVESVQRAMMRHLQVHIGDGYEVEQLYEARETIESRAAQLAAERADDDDIASLEAHLAVMRQYPTDAERFTAADISYHVRIARATKNPLMPVLLTPLLDVIIAGVYESIHADSRSTERGIADHTEILHLIKERRPREAADAMSRHLQGSRMFFPGTVLPGGAPTS